MSKWNKVEDCMPDDSVIVEVYVPELGPHWGRFMASISYDYGNGVVWSTIDQDDIPNVKYWKELEPVPNE